MKVNGEFVAFEQSQNISSLILEMGYSIERVAVVLNGEIVSKQKFNDVVLSESDKIEIISFVGGG